MILGISAYLGNEIHATGFILNKPLKLSKLWSNLIGTKLKPLHNAHIIPNTKQSPLCTKA